MRRPAAALRRGAAAVDHVPVPGGPVLSAPPRPVCVGGACAARAVRRISSLNKETARCGNDNEGDAGYMQHGAGFQVRVTFAEALPTSVLIVSYTRTDCARTLTKDLENRPKRWKSAREILKRARLCCALLKRFGNEEGIEHGHGVFKKTKLQCRFDGADKSTRRAIICTCT
jgi:hypothetical protein